VLREEGPRPAFELDPLSVAEDGPGDAILAGTMMGGAIALLPTAPKDFSFGC
jgi:hypothetical protein